jgi:flagellar assembly factor FliW
MPQIQTRDLGPLDYDVSAMLHFPFGLPGFEGEKSFLLIENATAAPVLFLQSTETPALCFLTIPVQVVDPGYQIGMTEEDAGTVGIGRQDVAVLAILASNSRGDLTANLLAPVIVNLATKIGLQAVRPDTGYSHQHPVGQAVTC